MASQNTFFIVLALEVLLSETYQYEYGQWYTYFQGQILQCICFCLEFFYAQCHITFYVFINLTYKAMSLIKAFLYMYVIALYSYNISSPDLCLQVMIDGFSEWHLK